MKTYKHLYAHVCSFENLYCAWRSARRGKRDRYEIADFEFDLEHNLLELQRELQTHTYQPGNYRNFYIREPKRRLVSAAPFRDRVVHHALCNIIEPIWNARFNQHSYACQVGKGTHRAIDQCQEWVQKYRYAFQGDIVKYFPSIDHQIMRNLLARHIADPDILWLIDHLLHSGAEIQAQEAPQLLYPGDDLFALLRPRGLPIGNLTSQFWANVYLNELDTFVKQQLRCPAYVRYMDDFILFSNEKSELRQWKEAVRDYLGCHLRLQLHPKKSLIFPAQLGVDFCGFRIYPTHRRLRKSSVRRFVTRLRRQRDAYRRGALTLSQMSTSVQSWVAHANHGNTWRLRARLFKDYPLYSHA